MGEFVMELWAFMKERKKFWLLPIILVLLMLGTLIVLTQGDPSSPSSAAPGVFRGWVDLQRRFAERSRRGRQVLVANSGHGIPVEAPDAVIDAVGEIVTTVRNNRY